MASSSGYVYSFDLYLGKSATYNKGLGLGGSVVMKFMNEVEELPCSHIYFDNFFTSLNLLVELKNLGITGTGTVRQNRVSKCPLTHVKRFQKQPRGDFETYLHSVSGILCTQWNDTKPVIVMSNYYGAFPLQRVRRYCKEKKSYSSVNQPFSLYAYNKHMGGVDLVDNSVSCYRIGIRSKKWYWPLFTNMISLAVVNSWRIHNKINDQSVDLLEHTRNIVTSLITPKDRVSIGRRSSITKNQMAKTGESPCVISNPEKIRRRCVVCQSVTVHYCKNCKCYLHIKCSEQFHE